MSQVEGAEPQTPVAPLPAGLPGLRGLEHVGFTVPDLKLATDFFAEVLGWPVIYAFTPTSDPVGNFMAENFGLHPRARVHRLAHVRSPLLNFELFEGSAPDQATTWPRMLDIGGLHLAVYVDNIVEGLNYLVDRGCTPFGVPKDFVGLEAGEAAQFVHVRTPFGLYLELVTYPNGRHYHDHATLLTWNPAKPDSHARAAVPS